MDNVVDIKKIKYDLLKQELVTLGLMYDTVSKHGLKINVEIPHLAAIMANRVGELARVFQGDKQALFELITETIFERMNYSQGE